MKLVTMQFDIKCDHITEIKFVSEAVRDGFTTVLGRDEVLYDMFCMV